MMEVVRTPQLRCARQLQARRERLEKEAHRLAQEEQRVMAQASTASSMATPGDLNISRREERQETSWDAHGQGQVPGSSTRSIASLQAHTDSPWCKPPCELPEVPGLQPGTENASDSRCRTPQVEQHHGLHARGLPEAHDQQDDCNQGKSQAQHIVGSDGKEQFSSTYGSQEQGCTSEGGSQRGGRGAVRG